MTHWLRFRELLSWLKEINGTVSRKWKANSSPVSKSNIYPSNQSEQSFLKTAGESASKKTFFQLQSVPKTSVWERHGSAVFTQVEESHDKHFRVELQSVSCWHQRRGMYVLLPHFNTHTQPLKTIFTPCIHTSAQPLSDSSNDLTLGWCVW